LRTHAIPERLRGVFTTRRYTNPHLPLPLPLPLPLHTCSRMVKISLASTSVFYTANQFVTDAQSVTWLFFKIMNKKVSLFLVRPCEMHWPLTTDSVLCLLEDCAILHSSRNTTRVLVLLVTRAVPNILFVFYSGRIVGWIVYSYSAE